jgi:hypothetical protein
MILHGLQRKGGFIQLLNGGNFVTAWSPARGEAIMWKSGLVPARHNISVPINVQYKHGNSYNTNSFTACTNQSYGPAGGGGVISLRGSQRTRLRINNVLGETACLFHCSARVWGILWLPCLTSKNIFLVQRKYWVHYVICVRGLRGASWFIFWFSR